MIHMQTQNLSKSKNMKNKISQKLWHKKYCLRKTKPYTESSQQLIVHSLFYILTSLFECQTITSREKRNDLCVTYMLQWICVTREFVNSLNIYCVIYYMFKLFLSKFSLSFKVFGPYRNLFPLKFSFNFKVLMFMDPIFH